MTLTRSDFIKPINQTKMKTFRLTLLYLSICFFSLNSSFATDKTDFIRELVKETKVLCEKDNGFLWGRNLYVPLLFVDESNNTIYTSTSSNSFCLEEVNGVYRGELPSSIKVEKGPIIIDGKTWALIPMPLPDNKVECHALILHEAFHCLQPKLRLKPEPYDNTHMEKMEARFWLKLEWKALELALQSDGDNRSQAITDAICFRKYRRALYSQCDSCENRFEIHEGMADYTANKICRSKQETEIHLMNKLEKMWASNSFVDCFAYYTGPVYAFLLDELSEDWRTHLAAKDNIAMLVKSAYKIKLPYDVFMEAEERSVLYSGAKIMGEELDRELAL